MQHGTCRSLSRLGSTPAAAAWLLPDCLIQTGLLATSPLGCTFFTTMYIVPTVAHLCGVCTVVIC